MISHSQIERVSSSTDGRDADGEAGPDSPGTVRRIAGQTLADFRTEATASGLFPAEEELLAATLRGEICQPQALEAGEAWPRGLSDKQRPPRGVRIRAGFLRMLALGTDPACPVHENGIQLVGAFIEGMVDLSHCEVARPLRLVSCWLENSLILREARLLTLQLSGSRVPGIDGRGLSVTRGLNLDFGMRCDGAIFLFEADIGGSLSCEGSRISGNAQGYAILAEGLRVKGTVFLRNGFRATGKLWLRGSSIGGDLDCSASEMTFMGDERHGVTLVLQGSRIDGQVLLQDGFKVAGAVSVRGAKIGGDLNCGGGSFACLGADGRGVALDASSARIAGNVFFGSGFRANGQVSLHSCEVGGNIELSSSGNPPAANRPGNRPRDGSRLIARRGATAFNATSARIVGNVLLESGVRVLGQWSMVGAEIKGYFQCFGTRFLNRSRDGQAIAIDASGARIRSVLMRNDTRVMGQISFRGVQVDGDLDCVGIVVANRADLDGQEGVGVALSVDLAKIKGDVLLSSCRISGQTTFIGAEVLGSLDCTGGRFTNATSDGEIATVSATDASIGGNVYLSGVDVSGKTTLLGARVGGQLSFDGGRFANMVPARRQEPARTHKRETVAQVALDLQDIEVADRLFLGAPSNHPDAHVTILGSLSLTGAHARQFEDDHVSWPPKVVKGPDGKPLVTEIDLDDFTYERINTTTPIEMRKDWLSRRTRFGPQPFEQLAKVLKATGREQEARLVAQEKQSFRRRSGEAPVGWGAYGFFVGYGYRPRRLILWLAALWLACAWSYSQAWEADLFVPAQPSVALNQALAKSCRPPEGRWKSEACRELMREYPAFNAFVYSLEHSLPVLDMHQKRSWTPANLVVAAEPARSLAGAVAPLALPLWWLVWAQTIVGWLGGLVLAAVLTGIVKKD